MQTSRRFAAHEVGDFSAGETNELRRRTAHEFALETLRRSILSGRLAGGTRLVQADIARQLGVSTTPVREALRDLASEGLVKLDAHRGAAVTEFDPRQMLEIYELRRRLEPLSMRLAAERITAEELADAQRLQERMSMDIDLGEWVDCNRRFHALLTDAARSPRLQTILKNLRDSAAVYVGLGLQETPTLMQRGNEEHRELLQALTERDGDRAEQIILTHLEGTMLNLGLLPSGRRVGAGERAVGLDD